ncbi:sensor histidine kinase [Dactylosporangium sp. CA-152071]|uniref:sensor histidine kinase n=1 Tax=Dactylosporangium sp. CA-152071 TaxID=3239933 RepID=UPI003D8C2F78
MTSTSHTSTKTRAFPAPADEQERLRSLADYGILGVPSLPDLPSVVELAAYICGVPNAVVNIISATQQHQMAAYGFEPGVCDREDSMCAISIVEPETVVVRDATLDPRFNRNPFVTGEIDDVRFYASAHLRDRDGHVLGSLCVFDQQPHELTAQQREGLEKLARMVMDVMDLHRHGQMLEQALNTVQRTTRELQRSNASLQHFAGQVSHDLKNPLTGVLGFVAMLAEIDAVLEDATAKRCVDKALSSATRMWRMIEDVLSHASLGGRPSFAQVDLGAVVQQVLDDVGAAISAAQATVDTGPLPMVYGDATQLRVLVQNLVSNSLKFRDRGRACHISITGSEDPDGWTFAVADNGIGMAEEDRPRVLEMFTRLRTDVEGSGIGLATCQRIVEAHDARLVIDGTPGGGTTVRITLPRNALPFPVLLS